MSAQLTPPTTSSPALTSPPSTPSQTQTQKPKPCCVCKDEKSARDECMLFSRAADPAKDCEGFVGKYKACMKGFGFELP